MVFRIKIFTRIVKNKLTARMYLQWQIINGILVIHSMSTHGIIRIKYIFSYDRQLTVDRRTEMAYKRNLCFL